MADGDRQTFCQVTEDCQSPAGSPRTESLEDIIRKLLPTPQRPPLPAPIPSDQELLIQRLLGVIRPPQPVVQERSKLTDLEIMLQIWLPVGTVTEEDAASPDSLSDSLEGCFFFCGIWTHTTDQCQTLDESFPFLPTGWQADHVGDKFILGPGPAGPPSQQRGNADCSGGRGVSRPDQ